MSKLNSQNATAYVGPGVLRKGGKITKVPNGPLIKKKGPFKGSTLKTGGTIKKAQDGDYKIGKKTYTTTRAKDDTIQRPKQPVWVTNPMGGQNAPYVKTKKNKGIDSLIDRATRGYKTGGTIKKAQTGVSMTKRDSIKAANKARIDSTMNARAKKFGFNTQEEYFEWQKKRSKGADQPCGTPDSGNKKGGSCGAATSLQKRINKNGGSVKKAKAGGMIKRADGSMSRRGLWDNIRANKGSGKKPTKQMLVQEKKIKAKSKK